MTTARESANQQAIDQLKAVRPMLVGVVPASEAMGIAATTILTSGPRLAFSDYVGGQRDAVVGAALYEGLAENSADAVRAFERGVIEVRGCQEFDCVGSLAGVTSASMPVLVVEDEITGKRAYCTLYEGDTADRLNYGSYTSRTRDNLEILRTEVAPEIDSLVRDRGGIALLPIMTRALTMGDELHSRNAAATLLFFRELVGEVLTKRPVHESAARVLKDDYFFLRLSMAASKLMANAMKNFAGSSVVTGMAFSCREFGIQVSGLGEQWFTGPVPTFEDYKLEPGASLDDAEIMGGESTTTEVVGLGGLSQAAAFPLVRASGGEIERMVERTRQMYEITVTRSQDFLIPALNYAGAPLGIDIEKVVRKGIVPFLDIGIAGKARKQIGGGVALPPKEAFEKALLALDSVS